MKLLSTKQNFVTNSSSDVTVIAKSDKVNEVNEVNNADLYETVRKTFQVAFSPDVQKLPSETKKEIYFRLAKFLDTGKLSHLLMSIVDTWDEALEAFYEEAAITIGLALALGLDKIVIEVTGLDFNKTEEFAIEDIVRDFEKRGIKIPKFKPTKLDRSKIYWLSFCLEGTKISNSKFAHIFASRTIEAGFSEKLNLQEVVCKTPKKLANAYASHNKARLYVIDNLIYNHCTLINDNGEITLCKNANLVVNTSHPALNELKELLKVLAI